MKNQAKRMNNPQGGSVLVIILVGIVLFAALSYAVTQSMRGGMGNIDQERSKFAAQEMIEYGQRLRDTVKELMISNGCTDAQITFEGVTYYAPNSSAFYNPTGYVNALAPTSKKCHVFHASGGNMRLITPAESINKTAITLFDGRHCYEGQGTGTVPCPDTAKELSMGVANIPLSLCTEINKIAGIAQSPPSSDNYNLSTGAGLFNGVYDATDGANNRIEISASGKNFGCYMDNVGTFANQYIFYYILLAR